MMQPKSRSMPVKPIGVGKISLRSLVRTDTTELKRIVRGLGNTVRRSTAYSFPRGCENSPQRIMPFWIEVCANYKYETIYYKIRFR